MNLFNVATKAASGLAIASVVIEGHDIGKRASKRGMAQASADKFVSDEIGASKLNCDSPKHSVIKDFIKNFDFTDRLCEIGGSIGGYFSGLGKCFKNNIFTVAFASLGLIAKSKPAKVVALAGMACSILFDTIINATSLFDRKDYLDK